MLFRAGYIAKYFLSCRRRYSNFLMYFNVVNRSSIHSAYGFREVLRVVFVLSSIETRHGQTAYRRGNRVKKKTDGRTWDTVVGGKSESCVKERIQLSVRNDKSSRKTLLIRSSVR